MGGNETFLPSSLSLATAPSHTQCALVVAVHLIVDYFLYLSHLHVCETLPVSNAHKNLTFMRP